jgi:hypothetical protein
VGLVDQIVELVLYTDQAEWNSSSGSSPETYLLALSTSRRMDLSKSGVREGIGSQQNRELPIVVM